MISTPGRLLYGPARYVPVLPGTDMVLDELRLTSDFETINLMDSELNWTVRVDNAPPNSGTVLICNVAVIDKRHQDRTDLIITKFLIRIFHSWSRKRSYDLSQKADRSRSTLRQNRSQYSCEICPI